MIRITYPIKPPPLLPEARILAASERVSCGCVVVLSQKKLPVDVHQAMTKEQKVGIFVKRFLATINQPKMQASLQHLLCVFHVGCSQGKYHHFRGTAGCGGGPGERTREGRGEGTPHILCGWRKIEKCFFNSPQKKSRMCRAPMNSLIHVVGHQVESPQSQGVVWKIVWSTQSGALLGLECKHPGWGPTLQRSYKASMQITMTCITTKNGGPPAVPTEGFAMGSAG